jgi:hypothetical protein
MFERWDSSRVVMFAVGADSNQLSEFIDVFGWRSVGLIDPLSSVYSSWRVPQPLAPYPQDYILDQQGRVAYWSDQYDAQEVIATIERLLATGVEEALVGPGKRRLPGLDVFPNPSTSRVMLLPSGLAEAGVVEVCDRTGRVVGLVPVSADLPVAWDPDLAAGAYFFRLRGPGCKAVTPVVFLR